MSDDEYPLAAATTECIPQLMPWFTTASSCRVWGGPEFRFPFTVETFTADCRIGQLPSYTLTDPSGILCAFGQYYLRAHRCHLARLAVSPQMQGRGLGTHLVHRLAQQGTHALGVQELSLFVSTTNQRAEALYTRLGFRLSPYPDTSSDPTLHPSMHYMIATLSELL
jgi:ribosomal protein S18 acetylase RimI-like enzyme